MQSPYSPEFIDAQKERLETEKKELVTRLESMAEYDSVEGQWIAKGPNYDSGDSEDIGDDATEANDLIENSAETEELSVELENVEAALQRIASGTYGWDEESQEYIPQERLEAYPAAAKVVEDEK